MELHRYNFFAVSSLPAWACNEISELERVIGKAIMSVGGVGFLKNGRKSCMDHGARVENRNTRRLMEQWISESFEELMSCGSHKSLVCDTTLILWCQLVARSLAVPTGFDAVQTLSSSMMASYALLSESQSHLYVRQFLPIDPCLEFRVFVYQATLTGITQKYALFSPWLHMHNNKVFQEIQSFVLSRIIPSMTDHPSFCADIIVFPELKDPQKIQTYAFRNYNNLYKIKDPPVFEIKLSQLIPFYPRAVIGLFDWANDQKNLKKGPFEVRYRSTPTIPVSGNNFQFEKGSPLVAKAWLEYIQQLLKSKQRMKFISRLFVMIVLLPFCVLLLWLLK